MRTYINPWIPEEAYNILQKHSGSLLDVGGGASPYANATHILDIQPFSPERLKDNAWPPSETSRGWSSADYTCLDIVSSRNWPFDTNHFDLGVSSHCLEDLRDPIPAVREMARVCKELLIICPSRLIEQTRGVEHPLFCGFPHHPWAVFTSGNRLIFRRKTFLLTLPPAHITCPLGKKMTTEHGSMYFFGAEVEPEEQVFWSEKTDLDDYAQFIEPYRGRNDLFVADGKQHSLRFWIWKMRQKYQGYL